MTSGILSVGLNSEVSSESLQYVALFSAMYILNLAKNSTMGL